MDVQLDLSMRTAGILEGWSLTDYQSEYKEILQTRSTGLEPRVIDRHQWYKNNQYLFYEAPGWGKAPRRRESRLEHRERPDRATRGHEACQRGTPPATTKAHGQVPSHNGRRVPQTRRARTTRTEPRHRNRCQATPAAVLMDECAPGGYPAPTGYEQPPSGWTSARPEGTQPLPATNSRRPDGRVRAGRVPPPYRLRTAAVRMDE